MAKKHEIAKAETASIQPVEQIESLIITIRGKQVILDRDLARLYGVETRVLNQAVQRNIERFPEDFLFQLTRDEFENLKSQNVTSSWGGVRKYPYAFTENGIAMLSGVLRSPMAIATNIHIMRAFNAMRHFIGSHAQVFQRIENIEKNVLALNAHQIDADKKIEEIFRRLDDGNTLPKEAVFFNGELWEARVLLEKIIKTAKKGAIIIDAYVDASTFEMLDVRAKGVTADIYSGNNLSNLQKMHNASSKSEPIDTHIWKNASHDRWLIVDDRVYHCGPSLKDMGHKLGAVSLLSINAEDILKHVR